MLARFRHWLDHRTGYKKLLDALLLEHIPGGAKWRYVWGSCLAFVFGVQLITGILLMTAYSPGDSTAWGSVYFIQYEMQFGWLIRGLHHFGSQAMVVLLGLHMLQVVIAGAHLPPREINWWLGLALMALVLGLSLTGYLLPWDQKGYWATQVATSIAGNIPGIGEAVKRLLVGGPEYGNHTLTRFYALHVGIFPALIVCLLIAHVALFRKHGVTASKHAQGECMFWPDQAFKDLLACLAVFAVVLGIVVFGGHGHLQQAPASSEELGLYDRIAYAGKDGLGANLDAPADPREHYPARPEWYFLFLFQLLKFFEGDQILIGTVLIPNAVLAILVLLPLLGYGKLRPLGHVVGVVVVVAVLTAVASLTCLALADDMVDPISRKLLEQIAFVVLPALAGLLLLQLAVLAMLKQGMLRRAVVVISACLLFVFAIGIGSGVYGAVTGTIPNELRSQPMIHVEESDNEPSAATKKAAAFRKQVGHAEDNAQRAVQLAQRGIPVEGGALLLQRDPLTAGKTLFAKHCGNCHSYQGVSEDGPFTASDLTNFGSKEWIRTILENAGDKQALGRTPHEVMKAWSAKHHEHRLGLKEDIAEFTLKKNDEARDSVEKELAYYDAWVERVIDWLATQPTGKPKENPTTHQEKRFAAGHAAFFDTRFKQQRCARCHVYGDDGGTDGPDLTGYGSADWIRLMIAAPGHLARYGSKSKMTAFRNDQGPGAEVLLHELAQVAGVKFTPLPDVDRELIIRFVLRDDNPVFFGRPISGPHEKK